MSENGTGLALAPAPSTMSSVALLMDDAAMGRMERIADLMASGKNTIPDHLKGNKGDCFAIVLQSMQWGMNPISVAQKTFLISGKLGYEAQLVAAVINNSGVVVDRFKFEWYGPWENVIGKFEVKRNTEQKEYRIPGWSLKDEEGCGIRVSATLRGEREPRVLELLLAQARTRNSTLWADDPKQQLAYLAQKRWARLYAPDVILGVYTPDEITPPNEIHMGAADVVEPAGRAAAPSPTPTGRAEQPAGYSDEDFRKNLPTWRGYIAKGRLTAEEVIERAQSSGPLTDKQKEAIRAPIRDDERPVDAQAKTTAPPPSPAPTHGPAAAPAWDDGPDQRKE